MLGYLFRTLTAPPPGRGMALFDAITARARQPHWYLAGGVEDTLDGRFAVLATITALVLVRVEQLGDAGNALSVALTERFIEVMESEHRELGIGDPTLGKTVRRLVGSLARRADGWRKTVASQTDWTEATRASLHPQAAASVDHVAAHLQQLWATLQEASVEQLEKGTLS